MISFYCGFWFCFILFVCFNLKWLPCLWLLRRVGKQNRDGGMNGQAPPREAPVAGEHLALCSAFQPARSAAPLPGRGQGRRVQGTCFRPWEMGQLGSGLCPGGGAPCLEAEHLRAHGIIAGVSGVYWSREACGIICFTVSKISQIEANITQSKIRANGEEKKSQQLWNRE